MWEKLIDWIRLLWDSGEQIKQHGANIEEMKDDIHDLYVFAQSLAVENERLREQLQHERELRESHSRELELRLRLQIAEELRRLPPPSE